MKPLFTGLCLLLMLTAAKLKAQVDTAWTPTKTYSQNQLQEDFQVLKTVLTEAHPSLHRYQTKAHADSLFRAVQQQLNAPMTELDFWKVLEPVIVSIHSAHTGLYSSIASNKWHGKHPVAVLPPVFQVFKGKLMMRHNKKDSINAFVQVNSIDSIPADEILSTLKKFIVGEGLSSQHVDYVLEGDRFSGIYAQIYGYKWGYNIEYTNAAGERKKMKLTSRTIFKGVGADKFKQALESKKDELNEVVSVTYPPDIPSTAILKLKAFTYYNYYASFHENFFKLISNDKIKNLVIDIRGNTGGYNQIGLDLLRYLTNSTCIMVESVEAKSENNGSFQRYVLNSSSDGLPGNYQRENYKWIISSPYYGFRKKLFLLVDKGTFSAAVLFAAALKNQSRVKIVGEETGGCEAGTDAGFFTIVQLPNTGLMLRLPRYHLNGNTEHPGSKHGVIPDYPVDTDPDKTEDAPMAKVKELILNETK